jgi:hypothetical protein
MRNGFLGYWLQLPLGADATEPFHFKLFFGVEIRQIILEQKHITGPKKLREQGSSLVQILDNPELLFSEASGAKAFLKRLGLLRANENNDITALRGKAANLTTLP